MQETFNNRFESKQHILTIPLANVSKRDCSEMTTTSYVTAYDSVSIKNWQHKMNGDLFITTELSSKSIK